MVAAAAAAAAAAEWPEWEGVTASESKKGQMVREKENVLIERGNSGNAF